MVSLSTLQNALFIHRIVLAEKGPLEVLESKPLATSSDASMKKSKRSDLGKIQFYL